MNREKLIQHAYDAAGSDVRWLEFLRMYVAEFGACAAALVDVDVSKPGGFRSLNVGFETAVAPYDHGTSDSPYAERAAKFQLGTMTHSHILVPKSVGLQSAFYNEFVQPSRLQLCAAMCRLAQNGSRIRGFGVNYEHDTRDDWIVESLATHQLFVPHLQTAVHLHDRIVGLESRNADLMASLETGLGAVAVCDGRGQILFMSPSAERITASSDGLCTSERRLSAAEPHDAASLRKAIADVIRLAEGKAATPPTGMRIQRPSGRSPYEVLACPVPRARDTLRAVGGRVMVFIYDPAAAVRSNLDVLSALYGLTSREAQVLQMLHQEVMGSELHDALGVSAETVKTHLRSLFAKTETRSQVQLVAKTLKGLGRVRLSLDAKA